MSDLVRIPCSICKEEGHHPRKCPDLTDPLRPGFSGAGGGGGGHGGDDEDEKLIILVPHFPCSAISITTTTAAAASPSNVSLTNRLGFITK